ncbi:tRNA pseudouridine(55) synthase TruB [bacterium]|nr:tRNA pseudouridine(55) synthase TruB [bacterium]
MDGILLIDKPIEWTSHDVVNFIRRRFRIKKVGHGGTLDPIASGLLVLFLGKTTKLAQTYSNEDKEYIAVMALGADTFTNDGTGEVLAKSDYKYISLGDIKKGFSKFEGEIEQIPPKISAVKLQGKRLYDLNRNGQDVEVKPRRRVVHNLQILHYSYPFVMFRIICSKGTYVRKICSDIGLELGCYAYMSNLIRTRSGRFSLSQSVTIPFLRTMPDEELPNYIQAVLPDLENKGNVVKNRREKWAL